MSDQAAPSKTELLATIEQAWAEFNAALDHLPPARFAVRDAQGWTTVDHLVHLAAWERSVLALLEGQPRHAGLGIDEALWNAHDVDAINAAVQQRSRAMRPDEARGELEAAHSALVAALAERPESDLALPPYRFLPGAADDGDTRTLALVTLQNTVDHYAEHLGWIRELTGSA